MKKRWKYGKQAVLLSYYLTYMFGGIFISSCGSRQSPSPRSSQNTIMLNEVVSPVNQSVLSNINTVVPAEKTITPVINSVGVISYDPRLTNNMSARFGGRIERLYVKFNFEDVHKGQRIMDLYSPEILTEQQNLLFMLSAASPDKDLISSSEEKLKLLGLMESQISQIETSRHLLNPLPIYSPYSGHIHDIGVSSSNASMAPASTNNNMLSMGSQNSSESETQFENIPSSTTSSLSSKEGMYVQTGQALFAIYNTSKVWVVLDVYAKDAPYVKMGDSISFTSETNPDHLNAAIVNYIEPILGQNASSIKVRVYLRNEEHSHFKIGALITAKIFPKDVNGMWLPRAAVVDLGTKKVVFIQKGSVFTSQTVSTGMVTDSLIQITSGLSGKEKVASNAQYLVDSESFIKSGANE
jgi:Cu(I)/Ag(I) efflux system membrane fusion protein